MLYTVPICSENVDKVWPEKIVGEWGEQMKKMFVSKWLYEYYYSETIACVR